MAITLIVLIAAGTLAFGAVYPWAYLPLFAIAAMIGVTGIRRGGIPPHARMLAVALALLCTAAVVQLVPLPRALVASISPSTTAIMSGYNLAFAAADRVPLSIDAPATRVAVLGLVALALYLLGLPSWLQNGAVRALPRNLAVFVVPLALFGIYSREYNNGYMYWFWETQDIPVPLGGGSNQFGPFVNRNHFGGWMLMALCLLIGLLFGQIERALPEGRRHRRLEWISSADANRIIGVAVAVMVGTISLFWTLSRSAILGLSAAVCMFAWLAFRRHRLSPKRRTVGVGAIGAILLAGVAWRGPVQLLEWFQDNHLVSRLAAWRDGWDVIQAFPLFGTGLNTYPTAMLFYQSRNTDVYMSQAHNDYVQLLAEGGALVAVPAVFAVVALAIAIRRNLRSVHGEARGYWIRVGAAVGLMAMGLQEILEFSLQMPANALFFCTLAGIALAPVSPSRSGTRRTRDTIRLEQRPVHVSLP